MTRSKGIIIVWVSIFLFGTYFLSAQENLISYSIINLQLENKEDLSLLNDLGIAADHVHWHAEGRAELFLNNRELDILNDHGFSYEIIIADTKAHADKLARKHNKENLKQEDCGLNDFALGNMGGYMVYEEVMDRLTVIAENYPKIAKTTLLGNTHQGNEIVALKISDNVSEDESLFEGTAYYDALTHAREPLSMMTTLYYIEWLLENYDNPNTTAKYLVDNREMHFVLIVNPDGYLYNAEVSPNGGGGWRKNRRVINDNCIGVDLNRNFNAKFAGPGRSSSDPCSDIYRGDSPNSEVETQIIQEFLDIIQPATAFSSHSFSEVIIDPDQKRGDPNYDFKTYANYASEFTPPSYQGYGPGIDLIGYNVSGSTLDYLYEAGTIAWSPEIGLSFYDPADQICDHVKTMLEPMKFISKIAGPAASYHDHYIADNSIVLSGETIELFIGVKNKGLRSSNKDYTLVLNSGTNTVSIVNPGYNFKLPRDNNILFNDDLPFIVELGDLDEDTPIPFELTIYEDELLVERSNFEIYPGSYGVLFKEDFENGMDKWAQQSNEEEWSLSDVDAKSGQFSLVDSKQFHEGVKKSSIGFIEPIDLRETIKPYLFFNIKHSFHTQNSSLLLSLADNDNLVNFTVGNKILERYRLQSYWKREAIDLKSVAQNFGPLYIKFLVEVEEFGFTDGVYIDDIMIIDLAAENTTPTNNTLSEEFFINIYPNPTTTSFRVELESLSTKPVERMDLHNALGQIIATKTNPSQQEEFSLAGQPQGTYFIKIETMLGSQLKKIVKL